MFARILISVTALAPSPDSNTGWGVKEARAGVLGPVSCQARAGKEAIPPAVFLRLHTHVTSTVRIGAHILPQEAHLEFVKNEIYFMGYVTSMPTYAGYNLGNLQRKETNVIPL